MNENANHDEDDFMGRVGGKYDFIMMVGDGRVYGFEGREIQFELIEDWGVPNGFQWKPIKGKDVDFNWLPLDGEYEYDDDEEDWVPFEDMVGSHDDEERYNDDGFDYREWM
jgi:hypothetical protein